MNKQPDLKKSLDNRVFGLIFSGIFCVIALLPILFGGGYRPWALVIAIAWAVPAIIFPAVLAPLNRLWAKFGQVMHKIINPVLMGLIFFLTVVPTGLIMKLLRKDPMRRKYDVNATTYWVERKETRLSKESFDEQF